jgi:hypothetical protein
LKFISFSFINSGNRMVLTVVYDGYVRSLAILPYSVFITNSVAGALELPADLVPVVTLDRLGRRWTLMMAMGLAGVTGIATGLVPQSKQHLSLLLSLFIAVCPFTKWNLQTVTSDISFLLNILVALFRFGHVDNGAGHGQSLLHHHCYKLGPPVHGRAHSDPVARTRHWRHPHHWAWRHILRSLHSLSGKINIKH